MWYLRKSITCYVDEIEFAFHIPRHVACIACQFLPDILLECCPAPSAHFLDLGVGVPVEGQSVGATASKGVCVDP